MARAATKEARKQEWARGGTLMAGTLLLIIGAYQIFLGITAIARNAFTVVGPNYYYTLNTTGWGWVHIGIGAVVLLAGFFVFTGSTVARLVGIAVAAISALGNFFLLPYFPVWAILIIALDIFAIWALATVRTDYPAEVMADERSMAYGGYGGGGMQSGERWPSENQPAGRHYATENVKEGETAQEAQERAAAGRPMPPGPGTTQGGGSQMPPGGQPPPRP
jgi:hypothetical protein